MLRKSEGERYQWPVLIVFGIVMMFSGCDTKSVVGTYQYELTLGQEVYDGTLKIKKEGEKYIGSIISFDFGTKDLTNLSIESGKLSCGLRIWGRDGHLSGHFDGGSFIGLLKRNNQESSFKAKKMSEKSVKVDRSEVEYILSDDDLQETELNINHAGLIDDLDSESFKNGERIYNSNCINCHGTPGLDGSIPLSLKFWEQTFRAGSDPFSLYQTISRGYGTMPPQLILTPKEKYEVIAYIRENFIREKNPDEYFSVTPGYLKELPKGSSKGPESKPHHPWLDQDYGNFFINTYELVDEETGPERFHSPGPTPFADEDYTQNNFAYKGIAVRLDQGSGGISKGNAWMIFDHDLMRIAGGWTGDGFIDWNAILLNDRHETYPRTVGRLHFETPVGPGWANPENGHYDDPRFSARDGRQFGPLPKKWADYKGMYVSDENLVISYTVGKSHVLEKLGIEGSKDEKVFTRTLNITPSNSILKLRITSTNKQVAIAGSGAILSEENGYYVLTVNRSAPCRVKIFIARDQSKNFQEVLESSKPPESLEKYTKGGSSHYPEELITPIVKGSEEGIFAIDQLSPPFENPWNCRMKLSGIDFFENANTGAVCTTDGDVFLIKGLSDGSDQLRWRRIAAGLFQPLGLKIIDEKIYVTCRDQLVRLQDLNGDGETDFYESFNHDHQVTDHFHEFAMGLQVDKKGNLYYAKSGRHAREALIPQHGTLIKVSKDGLRSEIVATGFRAANGVCINPDGSFLVTDQQGYWNPMNRINWIDVSGASKFYGNMWGYDPPIDSSDTGMEDPMVWVDMEFDRSPSELLWVESDKWGPLNGSLLSFSYGYGKIQLVLQEEVEGQKQGGVIDLPGMKFYTGVMRGRFHPDDQNLYLCGMEAWSTSQNMRTGDLYRVRPTGQTLTLPTGLKAQEDGVVIEFATPLDLASAMNIENYSIQTWDIKRSRKYGSDRFNVQTLPISDILLSNSGTNLKLKVPLIKPVDIMKITYNIEDVKGRAINGIIQNTIHNLGKSSF